MGLMNRVFKTYLDKIVNVFNVEHARSQEKHVEHRLYVKFSKYEFQLDRVQFLGRVVSKDEIFVDLVKVKAVNKWSAPTNISEI